MAGVREYTNKLLELVAEGVLDANTVLNSCLQYMSEADVEDLCECEGYADLMQIETEESEEEEEDPFTQLEEQLKTSKLPIKVTKQKPEQYVLECSADDIELQEKAREIIWQSGCINYDEFNDVVKGKEVHYFIVQ